MIKTTIESISRALNKFNSPIYVDNLKQGFQDNSFFIIPLSVSQTKKRWNLYEIQQSYDVQYFISSRTNAMKIAGDIVDTLQLITYEDNLPIRGKGISFEYFEGILHVFVTYNLLARTPLEGVPYMENLEIEGGVKSGG